jgi:hypothetical protein
MSEQNGIKLFRTLIERLIRHKLLLRWENWKGVNKVA